MTADIIHLDPICAKTMVMLKNSIEWDKKHNTEGKYDICIEKNKKALKYLFKTLPRTEAA